MKTMKKLFAIVLSMVMMLMVAACGNTAPATSQPAETAAPAAGDETENSEEVLDEETQSTETSEKHLNLAANFAYASLDPHKDYNGWYTSVYGITETLFKMADDMSIEPLLAEGYENAGNVWTIKINQAASFSNGNKVTADMVMRNLKRLAEENTRFAYMADWEMEATDDVTLIITTKESYPTLINDLATPEAGIIDLDNTTDIDNAIIATGPFVIDEFIPEGDVTVKKNENYWGGEVKLDSVKFYYMQEDEPKLMAMQSGEIDGYDSVTSEAAQIYQAEPDKYFLNSVAGTRLQFALINKDHMSDALRKAVNGSIDKDSIADFLSGTVSPTAGPYSADAAYGKANGPEKLSTEDAKALIESDGYVLNADGYYEKDGKELDLNICYYAARSLDSIALLIQEQLKGIGVKSHLTVEEDPDATYMTSGDYDIALYCMIADKSGDPYYFIETVLLSDSYYNHYGYKNDKADKMAEELATETDPAKRAELANNIIQMSIDENVVNYLEHFNKITVLKPGISGYADTNPFDFYAISKDTDIN